jgi:hypothetical protein
MSYIKTFLIGLIPILAFIFLPILANEMPIVKYTLGVCISVLIIYGLGYCIEDIIKRRNDYPD